MCIQAFSSIIIRALFIVLCLCTSNDCLGLALSPTNLSATFVAVLQSPSANNNANEIMSSETTNFESSAQSWLARDSTINDGNPIANTNSPTSPLPFILPSQLLSASEETKIENSWTTQILLQNKKAKLDKVKRVVDSSTIQLDSAGYVSLETVRGAGGTYKLPDCMALSPSYKLRMLLPKGTEVRYADIVSSTESSSSSTPRVWIMRTKDDLIINRELVRTGFAFVRKGTKAAVTSLSSSSSVPTAYDEMMTELNQLEQEAKEQGLGIFKVCDDSSTSSSSSLMQGNDSPEETVKNAASTESFIAEFEPLEYTTETQWGDDGGKNVLVSREQPLSSLSPPSNPGDRKGCSDFDSYEDALSWYERYAPYYGDVAKLDRDGDGVPCPGLPHTVVRERYRMKVPYVVDGK